MPADADYVLRHRRFHNLYARELGGLGVVARTNIFERAWRGSYSDGSEGQDSLERLYGCCDIVDEILAEFERVELFHE